MLLLATFRLTRRKLRERDLIATNPTWWHLGQSDVSSAIASITRTQLDAELVELRSKVSIANGGNNEVSLVRGDLLSENLPQIKADVIITSPPYLTRIDYVKATLPELVVLSRLDEELSIEQLRKAMIGSPVVGRGPDCMPSHIGEYAKSILTQIASHESKASRTYYLAFFSAYISRMISALEKIGGMSRPGARMVLVVQGSHYKEIFVDLAHLATDFANFAGFELVSRANFNFKQSFAQLNPRANGYSSETAQETALLFKRSY
ncbi:hypothetical protein RX327_07735 [Bradyrhizobium sp. BEA-2-5]|uniref:hypothetical protein n=1 Tax=Bradyrhizobium sp. BEA-2-5 TaxID=3080015 RepID=UPI00293F155F|nr:hypothetical protein [Bradyrhizobium sp. BEA-2-5]WOH83030.1 hypothetical protein RX327_07735 [Bradyrhizobium sp. BEA-2-5]